MTRTYRQNTVIARNYHPIQAKANKHEPNAYLRTVFIELPRADSVDAIELTLPIPTSDEDLAEVS